MNIGERLRLLRIVSVLSNLKYLRQLRKNRSLYKAFGLKRQVWQALSYNRISRHSAEHPWLDGETAEETLQRHPMFGSFDTALQQALLGWPQEGYIILPVFFENSSLDELQHSIETGLSPEQENLYHSNRLINLYRTNENVNNFFRHPSLLNILTFLLGKEALPFQTINFFRSSSQPTHSDAVHLTTEPLGYSLGVWIALEDVKEGSGEFFCYPGSHRLPYILNKDFGRNRLFMPSSHTLHKLYENKIEEIIASKRFEKKVMRPKKGDVIIWHTNLLHGSLPKENPELTRKSLIMHYFAKDVLCYHEMLEKPAVLAR